jgi:AraC-like DNA-binding protein
LLNTIRYCLSSAVHVNEHNSFPSGTSYGKRVVEHYELDYIINGGGYIITDGEPILAKKGRLFFRSPGMVVEGFPPYHCYFIIFDAFDHKLEFPKIMDTTNQGYIENLFSELCNAFIVQKNVFQFITRTYLMQIMLYMYNQWSSGNMFENTRKSQRKNHSNIYAVKEYIEKKPHLHFTLDNLAEMSGLSRYFFCRIFKELTGDSPINYVNRCRINAAKRLLIETEKSVKEIMLQSEFDNESHFLRLFKSQVTVNPSAFRQSHRIWVR